MAEEDEESIDHAAARWFLRLQDHAVDEAERIRFQRWIAADPRHATAWHQIEAIWTGSLPLGTPMLAAEARAQRRGSRSRRRAVLATGLLGLVGAGAWFGAPPGLLAQFRTGTGERQQVTLADGTQIHLDAETALSTRLDGDLRQVTLHAGHAFFEVPRDPRPFLVTAADGAVQTATAGFDINMRPNSVTVTAASEMVEVRHGAAQARLGAGQALRYGPDGLTPARSIDLSVLRAWQHDQIFFQNALLRDVLNDLGRYRRGRIMLTSRALGQLRITGSFNLRRTDQALATIGDILPLRIRDLSGLLVVISAA
jgi:transmembrane sensor